MDQNIIYEIVGKAKMYDELIQFPLKDKQVCCSFCGKSQGMVKKIVAGPRVFICDECVELCTEIIVEELAQSAIKATEQPSEAAAEEEVYGNDCRNGQC